MKERDRERERKGETEKEDTINFAKRKNIFYYTREKKSKKNENVFFLLW